MPIDEDLLTNCEALCHDGRERVDVAAALGPLHTTRACFSVAGWLLLAARGRLRLRPAQLPLPL